MPSDSLIKSTARQITGAAGSENAFATAKSIFKWLKENTQYQLNGGALPSPATETLRSGGGDCDDLSFLYISLCRAAGIPARFVSGYIVRETGLEPHAWVEFYAGQWIPVEVAGTGTSSKGIQWELNGNFATIHPDHVALFTDDGSNESLSIYSNVKSFYLKQKPEIEPVKAGSTNVLENSKLVIYKDGRRELKPMDWEPKAFG